MENPPENNSTEPDEQEMFANLGKELGQSPRKPIPDGLTWEQTTDAYLRYPPNSDQRFAFGYLYLTGQRATEALATRRQDITTKELEGTEFLVIDSINLKNPVSMRRQISIPFNRREKVIVENTWKHLDDIHLEAKIFPYTRQTLGNWLRTVEIKNIKALDVINRKLVDINLRIHPHYARHIRAYHMADYYEFDSIRMMKYFGWRDSRMPDWYIQGSWKYLARGYKQTGANEIG